MQHPIQILERYWNFTNFKPLQEDIINSVLEGEDCTNELADKYTSDELKSIKDYYQRNMELSFIVMAAWYILQILDASVDAHLYYWEVDEDLSVDIQPIIQPIIPGLQQPGQEIPYNGIKVRFKF